MKVEVGGVEGGKGSLPAKHHTLSQPFSHLPGNISGEVAVRSKLQVAAVSGGVVHHVYLSRLAESKKNKVIKNTD